MRADGRRRTKIDASNCVCPSPKNLSVTERQKRVRRPCTCWALRSAPPECRQRRQRWSCRPAMGRAAAVGRAEEPELREPTLPGRGTRRAALFRCSRI